VYIAQVSTRTHGVTSVVRARAVAAFTLVGGGVVAVAVGAGGGGGGAAEQRLRAQRGGRGPRGLELRRAVDAEAVGESGGS
jgi:hypothetical protein